MPEEIKDIIRRLLEGSRNPADIEVIAEAIQVGQVILVTGDSAVGISGNVENSPIVTGGSNVTGDNNVVIYGPEARLIQEIVRAIFQEIQCSIQTIEKQTVKKEPLKELDFDAQSIEKINLRLKFIEQISKAQQLSQIQEEEFNALKGQVNLLDQNLKDIYQKTQILLEDTEQLLKIKLKELNSSNQNVIGLYPQQKLERQIQIIQRFRMNLQDSNEAADWLNQNRVQISRQMSEFAFSAYPHIKSNASQKQVNDFQFLIEKLLERISHCLIWGRYNILDSLEIPLVFSDIHIYEVALNSIKGIIPSRLSKDSIRQLDDSIQYLIERLPYYQ